MSSASAGVHPGTTGAATPPGAGAGAGGGTTGVYPNPDGPQVPWPPTPPHFLGPPGPGGGGGGTPQGGGGTPRPNANRPRILHLPEGFIFPFAIRGDPPADGFSPGETTANLLVISHKKKMNCPTWIPPTATLKASDTWKNYAKLYGLYVYSELKSWN